MQRWCTERSRHANPFDFDHSRCLAGTDVHLRRNHGRKLLFNLRGLPGNDGRAGNQAGDPDVDAEAVTMYDHDTTTVKGVRRLHSALRRDWVCSACGSKLATRWFDDAPHWRTVCVNDPGHHPDGFIHKASWAYVEAQQQMDHLQSREIFSHLPPELQAAIRIERS